MSRTTFIDWLRSQADRDDPVGDLARDLNADPANPDGDDTTAVLRYVTAAGGTAAAAACLVAVAEFMAGGSR